MASIKCLHDKSKMLYLLFSGMQSCTYIHIETLCIATHACGIYMLRCDVFYVACMPAACT